jgi:hypothetical protein
MYNVGCLSCACACVPVVFGQSLLKNIWEVVMIVVIVLFVCALIDNLVQQELAEVDEKKIKEFDAASKKK